VNASSNYTGLNWATDIPAFLLEMGFMSNPAEDRLLSDPDYQARICQGIANFCIKLKGQ
jgi:N-acetylmuramoyl-L-alanine amidase